MPLVAREARLSRAVGSYDSSNLDYIFIDCPPSLGLLTVNALVAAPEVLIPIQCEYYALEGLEQLLRTVELVRSHLNPDLAVTAILLTMYDGRTRLASQVADEVREHFGGVVLGLGDSAQRQGVGGAELRPVGDDLRPGFLRCGGLPRGGAGACAAERPAAAGGLSRPATASAGGGSGQAVRRR